MATIKAINISARRGTIKTPVPHAILRIDHGIVGMHMRATGIAKSVCSRRRVLIR